MLNSGFTDTHIYHPYTQQLFKKTVFILSIVSCFAQLQIGDN